MSSAEEVFLRNREERERARLAAAGKFTNELYTEQRATLLKEIDHCESRVQSSINADDKNGANAALRELRRLVQDAAATATLTAYEMAKANNMVSHLQDLLSEKTEGAHSGAAAAPVSTNDNEEKSPNSVQRDEVHVVDSENKQGKKKPKKFHFSAAATKREKTSTPSSTPNPELSGHNSVESGATDVGLHGASPQGSQVASDDASYGPCSGKDIFIPSSRALFVKECDNCDIFVLPIAGSAFISGCKSCRIYISCTQLRLKNCIDTEVYVWVASTPIIENCRDMRFGPYTCWRGLVQGAVPLPTDRLNAEKKRDPKINPHPFQTYTTHRSCVEEVGEMVSTEVEDLEKSRGEQGWRWVEDFQWLKKTPSPHWRTLSESEYQYRDTVFGAISAAR